MVRPFDACEEDIFGDLAEDTHGIWEVFEFVRLHHPSLPEEQVFKRGLDYVTRWIQNDLIRISGAPLYPSGITTLSQLSAFLEQHGSAATQYLDDSPSIDLTEDGLSVFKPTI